jgi:catechol 2,3-dioxygenase-like lactoylglutathione lyase family enzyme
MPSHPTSDGPIEILASRFLLHPLDYERSLAFYRDTLGLHVMREFGAGAGRGVVFFLGGGFLELTGRHDLRPAPSTELWLQVRDVEAVEHRLAAAQVTILESAIRKPWGLIELRASDPDGLTLVFVEIPPDHPLRRDLRSLPETE